MWSGVQNCQVGDVAGAIDVLRTDGELMLRDQRVVQSVSARGVTLSCMGAAAQRCVAPPLRPIPIRTRRPRPPRTRQRPRASRSRTRPDTDIHLVWWRPGGDGWAGGHESGHSGWAECAEPGGLSVTSFGAFPSSSMATETDLEATRAYVAAAGTAAIGGLAQPEACPEVCRPSA